MTHEFDHAEEAAHHLRRSMDIQGPAKEQAYARGQLHASIALIEELRALRQELASVTVGLVGAGKSVRVVDG
jgi:hypothetical protein